MCPDAPVIPDPEGLVAFLRRVNRARAAAGSGGPARPEGDPVPFAGPGPEVGILEEVADTLFGASRKLAVYGSLRPDGENHHVVEDLEGRWRRGFVRGRLLEEGWGAGMGYPAMVWEPDAGRVEVALLESAGLPSAWPRLDAFEGAEYRRILVPVRDDGGVSAVANLYALARSAPRG